MASGSTRDVFHRRSLRRVRADAAIPGRSEPLIAIPERPRILSFAGRISVGALGLTLALIISVVWGTALVYLAVRLGGDTRLRLEWIDAAHVYVGLVGGVVILAKISRVWLHFKVAGVPEVVPWQRWLSWSLLILYSCVWVSGILLLTPIRGLLYGDLVNFHLLSSVWALFPTTWHVWHYRRRAAPFLTRILPRGRSLRYWAGVGLAILPAIVVIANARSISQLPQVLGGSSWVPVALNGSYLDRVMRGPNGELVAAGDAVYTSPDGTGWTQIDIPAGPPPNSAIPSPVHQHGAPTGRNLALALAMSKDTIFVGTNSGLFETTSISGPLQPAGFDAKTVYAIAVDPANPQSLWVGSSAGIMQSSNDGSTWQQSGSGLIKPSSVTASRSGATAYSLATVPVSTPGTWTSGAGSASQTFLQSST